MTLPVVNEIRIRLEPVTADPFIDGVGGAGGGEKKAPATRVAGSVATR
jgi:hypothetical protein